METEKITTPSINLRHHRSLHAQSFSSLHPKDDQQILSIQPPKIEFKNVLTNKQYDIEIIIRNKTQKMVKFKLYDPKNDVFKISHDHKSNSLSAGLSKKYRVYFHCKDDNDYYDQFKIACQGKTYVIPVKAIRAFFNVKYNPLIQGGIVGLNLQHRFSTIISNLGTKSRVKIIKQTQQSITVSPDQFIIEEGHQQQISLFVIPNVIGTYKHKLLVQVNGHMSQPIVLVYSSTQFKFYLTSEQQKILSQLDIGYCFYGKRKTVQIFAVNNTPETIQLKPKIRLGWKFNESALQSPQQLGIQCSSTIIQVLPLQTEIKPFSKQRLTLICQHEASHEINMKIANFAKRQENNKKFSQSVANQAQSLKMLDNQFHETLIAQFGQKKIYCSLKVTCGYPLIKIQPANLIFGQIGLKKTDMRKIKIKNVKQNLPVKIVFPKTFCLEIIPSSSIIGPNSEQQFEFFLTPVTIGVFSTNITCYLCNLFKIDIPISYQVFGQTKRQSASAHRNSDLTPLNEMNLTCVLNKTNLLNRTMRFNQKSQNNFRSKILQANKTQLHSSLPKQNAVEPASDMYLCSKPQTYDVQNQDEQELISGIQSSYQIPIKKDTLFVTRKIDKYQPYKNLNKKYKVQTRQIVGQLKKIPKNKKQHLELCKQLPSQALKNVNVPQKVINFGKVFVHSKICKQFEIINNNDFSIQVKLTPSHQFLSQTDTQAQLIPGKTKSKFKIILIPKSCGQFQSLIDYSINCVHHFRFLVQAQIQLVTLSVSKFNLKLNYQDDVKDMLLSDTFDLTNQGNTSANFVIQQNSQRLSIQPKSGLLNSGQSIAITVVYNSTNSQTIPAGQPKNIKDCNKPTILNIDQRIIVKVKNGVDMFLRVQSITPQPKCYIKQSKINFGCCMMPKSKSKSFVLKNLGRNVCLYQLDYTGCQNFLQFDCPKGKVLPESSKQIMVTYRNTIIQQINTSFKVIIRGGLIINVPIHAESVAPKISVLQSSFNFGQISCGSTERLPINIRNDSQTMVQLIFDLMNRLSRGAQFLDISFEDIQKEQQKCRVEKANQPMIHKIKVQAKSTTKFMLLFQPNIPGFYQFQLPIYIQNFIKNDQINKTVTCYAKQPKFFLEPAIVKFKKKIINDKDNTCFHPLVQFVTLKNPSDLVLRWKIQLPKIQNGKKLCFQIQNRKGEVKAKSWQCINIAFNPYQQGNYCYKFPVLIYNWDKGDYIQYAQIKVQGQGQYPILLFDRKELILPVVPLQIQSVGMFKIINQGYQTIDIKHRICSIDYLSLIPDIILFYPQGSKMGINKKQSYVIVKFVAKKPVSFTVKLEIYDGCRIYQLPISGTSDNSLFTIFPYLSDKQNLYKLQTINQTITLRSIDTRNIIDKLHNHYQQVTQADYYLPCEIIRRWINTILKDDKVMRFPEDIVNSNEILIRFLYKITNKKDLQKIPPQCQTQQKFYQCIIRILKSMGCLLNHIRPYFLLNKQNFYEILQDISIKHMVDNYKKYYRVIHLQSWIILFYQIVSNFWYNPQKIKINDIKSNVYSNVQVQVLKWIRQIYQQYNQNDDRKFVDLNRQFKDCFAPIYALYHYNFMNKNQSLQGLNKHAVSINDYNGNIRILYSMLAKANLIPLISQDEYQNIKQKQMFILFYQLYESLPQQLPKTAPIIFTCQLGQKCMKYIQIKNPSHKYVNYWIRIQGSTDYSTQDVQCIRIQPKSIYKLGVEFKSRVSQQEVAYLILFNKKQSDNNSGVGCSLVFQLKSLIVGRKSIKKLQNIRCPLYENTSMKIAVQNTFNDKQYGNFKIILSQQLTQSKQSSQLFNFYLQIDSIKIRRNTTNYIQLFYSPMILKSVKCFIIFCDPAVGQFQYQIIGIPQVPKPLQQIKIQNPVYLNTQQSIQLNLPVYNNFMIKALSLMEQKWQNFKVYNKNNNKTNQYVSNYAQDDKQQLLFKVQVNMDPKILQFIKFPNQLTIFHRKKSKTDIRNRLKIQWNFNMIIKDLVLDFVLLNHDKRDVRRFKALINVTSQPIVTNLVMKTNARTPLVQQIPFQNTSSKDWKINCQIIDMQSNQFSLKQSQICLQKDYVCKKNCQVNSFFVYNPDWISQSACKLKIANVITNQQIIYNIKGISQQPLSDDHLYFSTYTGKSNLHSLQIRNPYNQKLSYHILTDLVEIECSPQIIMEAQQKVTFNIIISVNSPGIFIGFLKFVDKLGRYFWYSVTIQAEDQIIYQQKIRFQSLIDEQTQKVLQFKNSLSKTSAYKVDFDCPYLIGQKSFNIKPYSSYLYRLKFKPTTVINQQNTIRIFCPQKGAHLYKVQMISHQHYKRQLVALKVQVGRKGYRQVKLTEVSEQKQHFNYTISNTNFYLQCSQPDANGQVTLHIYYKPIAEGSQKCTIKVIYGFNKTKVYEIQGIGIAPFTIQTVQFQSIDLKPVLERIKFKNPYQKNCGLQANSQIFVCYIQKNQQSIFNFVGYGQRWQTKIVDVLAIPIEFKPKKQGYFESMLTVQSDQYKWQYLLKGSCINEVNKNCFDEQIKCKTRQQCIKVLAMQIPQFLKQQSLKPNRIQVDHPDPQILSLIKSCLNLKIQMNDNRQQSKSTIYLRFRPRKPLRQFVTFSLFCSVQQSIKVNKKIKLISQPPQPQQTVSIQINSIKTYIFNIPIPTYNYNLHQFQSRMQKSQYFQSRIKPSSQQLKQKNDKNNEIVQLKFIPNNCTFKNNYYSDLLILESEQEYRSFKIQIRLKNKVNLGLKSIITKDKDKIKDSMIKQ